MMQRDTSGLTSENSDLKMRVQTMKQQVRLQDGKTFFMYLEFKGYSHECLFDAILSRC
jgi:hypothetical protein